MSGALGFSLAYHKHELEVVYASFRFLFRVGIPVGLGRFPKGTMEAESWGLALRDAFGPHADP